MNEQEFIKFFTDLFEDCTEEIEMDTEFRYLENWSSLTGLYFITDMKEKYGKEFTVTEFKGCETIEDLYNLYINK